VEAAAVEIKSADIFLTQLELPLAPTIRGIEIAYAAGVPVIVNPAPAIALSPDVLQKVHYLTPNESEAITLIGGKFAEELKNTEQLTDHLLAFGVRNVALTLGEKGVLVKGGGSSTQIAAFQVGRVIETTGAGDAFTGGFAVALAEGKSLIEAARYGSAVAGISVTRLGTAPSMPHRKEVDALIRTQPFCRSGSDSAPVPPGNSYMKKFEIAKLIDHTLLHADATPEEIAGLCEEAAKYHFASVCVNPCNVAQCAKLLAGTVVAVCTVIGFPLGANTKQTKAFETREAVADGALEVDTVINLGALKARNRDTVYDDIKAVISAAKGALVKVIIEACYLTDEEKVLACQIATQAGANFVKTSTGFGPGGATAHDVALVKASIGPGMGSKHQVAFTATRTP
jgi:deoxyribose-phosphate aldolase